MLYTAFSISKHAMAPAPSPTYYPVGSIHLRSASKRLCIFRGNHCATTQRYSAMAPTPFEFQEPIHILGAGSIGLLWAASIRSTFPSYPVQLLLRQHHQHRVESSFSHTMQQTGTEEGRVRGNVTICLRQANVAENMNKSGESHPTGLLATRPRMIPVPAATIPDAHESKSSDKVSFHRQYDDLRPIKNLLLTTKAFQAVDALTSVLHRINEKTHIIVLCNGALAVRHALIELLQHEMKDRCLPTIHLALTTYGAYRKVKNDNQDEEVEDDGLFHLVHAGCGRTLLQNYPDMAKLWDMAGLNCQSTIHLEQDLWYKLAANCVINPLTALHACNNGDLVQTTTAISSVTYSFDQIANEILQEISAVAQALLGSDEQYSVSKLRAYVQSVIDETRHNKSSMLQDVLAQRKTEIDYLNGYVVQQGFSKSLACPLNKALVDLIHATQRTQA